MTIWTFIEKRKTKVNRTETYGSLSKMYESESITLNGFKVSEQTLRRTLKKAKGHLETDTFIISKSKLITKKQTNE